jgi:hypothetical protein
MTDWFSYFSRSYNRPHFRIITGLLCLFAGTYKPSKDGVKHYLTELDYAVMDRE